VRASNQRQASPVPKFHDCWYVAARDQFILQAVRIATEKCGERPADANEGQRSAYSAKWNNAYAVAMDKLAAPLLKQSSNGARRL
jgi:hypothetical protein